MEYNDFKKLTAYTDEGPSFTSAGDDPYIDNETEKHLSESQRQQIIQAVEDALSEGFMSKPGWNWPASSAKRFALEMQAPDGEGNLEVFIKITRKKNAK